MSALNQLLPKLVGLDFGILDYIIELQLRHIEPDLHIGVTKFQDPYFIAKGTRGKLPYRSPDNQATGAGLDRESMLWSTIGEAIERYAGSFIDLGMIEYETFDDIGNNALDPRDAILFADWQYQQPEFEFQKFDTRVPFGWVQGFNLSQNCPAYIPATFTYLGYTPKYDHEVIDNNYSTGLAAGPSLASAIYSGILEVIERDAFSCHWLTGISPPKLDISEQLDQLPIELKKLLEVKHIDYNLRNFTTDIDVPTIVTILKSGDEFGFSLGASSHPKLGHAFKKSIIESFHTFNWVMDIKSSCDLSLVSEDIITFSDHLEFYLNKENHSNLDFLYNNTEAAPALISKDDFSSGFANKQELNSMVSYLKTLGLEVFVVDLTTEDVLELGFHVSKVIIPGLQPIYCGTGNEQLDPRRLQKFVTSCGYEMPSQLNLSPHAFP
jgi:ribosomal protein S12 methylthiotransferase accessory factor